MNKNLYINQPILLDRSYHSSAAETACLKFFGSDWNLFRHTKRKIFQTIGSWYPRFGKNILNFHTQTLTNASLNINFEKDLKNSFQTFETVTDQRLHQLRQDNNDKPWLIAWSGGIDSTVIVTSVLKHIPAAGRKNFAILCDPGAVWENPLFFQKHILPNFSVIDSTNSLHNINQYKNNFYVIDGEPADCLWGHRTVPYLGKDASCQWKNHSSRLFNYINRSVDDIHASKWLITTINDNIDSVDLPIDTLAQWLWWFNFNFGYVDALMRKTYRGAELLDQMNAFYINWYHTREYNHWSILNNLYNAPDISIGTYKLEAKKYVSTVFDDNYHAIFKTKGASNSRHAAVDSEKCWLSIRDDQTFCYDVALLL